MRVCMDGCIPCRYAWAFGGLVETQLDAGLGPAALHGVHVASPRLSSLTTTAARGVFYRLVALGKYGICVIYETLHVHKFMIRFVLKID